ncbi:hypothetical protein GCM10007923_05710 [Shinella yambaruensis]|uniref:Uncharacterized protein n=1 Tax=Shinella yambaruensis TaxID=415996 RepID=A0ABQ5ZCT1_9HYPH|nr:hypothetical protein GCM10007923_05710 [Shinella yambaruensis]
MPDERLRVADRGNEAEPAGARREGRTAAPQVLSTAYMGRRPPDYQSSIRDGGAAHWRGRLLSAGPAGNGNTEGPIPFSSTCEKVGARMIFRLANPSGAD